MQLSPARGRLPFDMVLAPLLLRCSLSPRGDGYRSVRIMSEAVTGCSLSPRGDGYCPQLISVSEICRCSLSPRGDGYFVPALHPARPEEMQLIPARGRLLLRRFEGDRLIEMQLIPARGRLLSPFENCLNGRGYSLAPRGDSLHVFSPANFRHFIDNSHILCYTSWRTFPSC